MANLPMPSTSPVIQDTSITMPMVVKANFNSFLITTPPGIT